MPIDPQLRIASRLLSGLISQDRHRTLAYRMQDIQHSLEVAAELIRQREGGSPSSFDHAPPAPEPPAVRTKERVIEREPPPLRELLSNRRDRATRAPARPTHRGPTLH